MITETTKALIVGILLMEFMLGFLSLEIPYLAVTNILLMFSMFSLISIIENKEDIEEIKELKK